FAPVADADVFDACMVRRFELPQQGLLRALLRPAVRIHLDMDAFEPREALSEAHVPLSALDAFLPQLMDHPVLLGGKPNTLRAWCALYARRRVPDLRAFRVRLLDAYEARSE